MITADTGMMMFSGITPACRQYLVDHEPVQAAVAIHERVQVHETEGGTCRLGERIHATLRVIDERRPSVHQLAQDVRRRREEGNPSGAVSGSPEV